MYLSAFFLIKRSDTFIDNQVDLLEFIDWSSVECLNQNSAHALPNALKQVSHLSELYFVFGVWILYPFFKLMGSSVHEFQLFFPPFLLAERIYLKDALVGFTIWGNTKLFSTKFLELYDLVEMSEDWDNSRVNEQPASAWMKKNNRMGL